MADDWKPLFLLTSTTTRQTPNLVWRTGSTTPKDVDDQAPIPLIVGIALALFIGFVIIVCCICRRRSLTSSSSATQDPNSAAYQRAPMVDGPQTGFNAGMGVNSYPMVPVNSSYPPSMQGHPAMVGMPGQQMTGGGMPMGQQHPPPVSQQSYPALPPSAYSPPYPIVNSPLPSYMPTSQSSSASGPSSEHGPSGFSSSSPPAPAPAPTGMMVAGSMTQTLGTSSGGLMAQPRASAGTESGSDGTDLGVSSSGAGSAVYAYPAHTSQGSVFSGGGGGGGYPGQDVMGQGQMLIQGQGGGQGQGGVQGQGQGYLTQGGGQGYLTQGMGQSYMNQGVGQAMGQGHMNQAQGHINHGQMGQGHITQGMGQGHISQGHTGQGHIMGQGHTTGGQGQNMGHPGFQTSMGHPHMGMTSTSSGAAATHTLSYATTQGLETCGMGSNLGAYPQSSVHQIAMDYRPMGGVIPRVGSPLPPGTIVTELDQL